LLHELNLNFKKRQRSIQLYVGLIMLLNAQKGMYLISETAAEMSGLDIQVYESIT